MKIKVATLTAVIFVFIWWSFGGYKETFISSDLGSVSYDKNEVMSATSSFVKVVEKITQAVEEKKKKEVATTTEIIATHVKTPEEVKAVYISAWVAGTPSIRNRVVKMIEDTELNSIVIDVKDNTGVMSWDGRVRDLPEFIDELHKKNIYVIARVSAFQDPIYVKLHPELAVTNFKTGGIWKDHKGIPWIDTGSKQMWDFLVKIGEDSYAMGFDEINYDYIRFPTDGKLSEMRFPVSGVRGLTDKAGIVGEFYKYLHDNLSIKGIPISGDVFGIILVNQNETKTLGQDLHDALKYFDYVAPMVYPSHFYTGTANFKNPAEHPGEIIDYSMRGAVKIAGEVASSTKQATSTIVAKLRPWYQDFDMGATYTAQMVRAQITAGEKLGVRSWMLWDPANKYTPTALKSN